MNIIDRFEGDFAVVETDEGMVNIPVADLPDGAKEGDELVIATDGSVACGSVERGTQDDGAEAAARKDKIDSMMNALFK